MENKLDVRAPSYLKELFNGYANENRGQLPLQLFGGYGYMTEYPISRFFVDARIQRIYGGTNEIMKEIVVRSMFGR